MFFPGFPLLTGTVNSAYSLATERGDQLVRRTKLARLQLGWGHGFKHSNSLRDIYSQIVLCGLDALVTEPQCDFADIARRLEDIECAAVTKHVWRYPLAAQRWTDAGGHCCMLSEQSLALSDAKKAW